MYKYMYSACIAWNSTYCLVTHTKKKKKKYNIYSMVHFFYNQTIFNFLTWGPFHILFLLEANVTL